MRRSGRGRRVVAVVILIAAAIVVFATIRPVVGDGSIAAIIACLSVLPFVSSFLGASDTPFRKRARS